ncbi:MAG: NUDIX hydrolase [Pseudomonadota bacterium]
MSSNALQSIICPKLCLLNPASKEFLLCKRKGEADFDRTYSFPGGKTELSDESIEAGIQRELAEELGSVFAYELSSQLCFLVEYVRSDSKHMTLPHFFGVASKEQHIDLNAEEYNDYAWTRIEDMAKISVIKNVPMICALHPLLSAQRVQ